MPSKMKAGKDLLIFAGKFMYSFWDTLFHYIVPRPKKNVAGEIVLITGSGSGIGRLLALRFAHLGAILVLWDINPEGNQETCELAKKAGTSRVYTYTCNCSDREDIYRVAAQVKKEVGDVTILINNAGVVTGKQFLEIPDECVEKSFDVNSKAHIWTYKAFLPAMITNNHGHLVCISSSAGLIGVSKLSDYCASKFAAIGFAESIFSELYAQGYTGIKSTIVCPFFIKTGMFEGCTTENPLLLPILEPDYVVNKIMNAILEEQVYLFMPRFLYFVLFLKRTATYIVATV
ncbi:epidermal retinol dehydrogenase 2-like isoform X2 [Vombatus ursinus]|uniref:epidermal retinol dehydrogenase 2-like isoform X2 n=1 Tax=Vombatus ursinus TaxID=29139 RepID=UPI000FFD09E5|nr:epidermal retinol dehydrogenase 2-like isoform X2 [Vombatus ursinus]XP_027732649.1 epidermal retinol dehydrogenase 2-like isoform X2 [Vombatus ursinus]